MKQLSNNAHVNENQISLTFRQGIVCLFFPMRKLITFISIIFFLASCDHYYDIPEDMKPLLVNENTICFLDSMNNRIDSFQVKIEHYYENRDMTNHWEKINVGYLTLNKQNSFKVLYTGYGFMGASNSIDGYDYKTIRVGENNTDIIKSNVSIHGIIYPTVYVLHDDYFPDTIPNTVYFTYKYGIIRYEYKDGRKYELMKK